ncbi:calmodulin [Thecamonas trahens ATCC 50062]|uniref:Calmodulin n=1 Tax=Thecamonas trahens ATCC 50062 TaxID=461836 RepID=A0A0L0D8J6_THETB|nr:calmodulin [Thecamonas trahens ATCC 50062]KNC48664.1 calmodulin [Thecamonas trahens ATCC 50062]|eukprot:XP_013762720.1 calmodulin [Thecamonas trahens ATCC 50062]
MSDKHELGSSVARAGPDGRTGKARLADVLTAEQLGECRALFDEADADGNGTIDPAEAMVFLRRLGLNPSQAAIDEWLAESDADGSGTVTFDDFVAMFVKDLVHEHDQPSLEEAFRIFDLDGSGTVSVAEFVHILTSMGEPLTEDEARAMIAEADVDNDGVLNCREFVQLMHSW